MDEPMAEGRAPKWEHVCCDEALLQILPYLDTTSVVRLAKGTSRGWRQRSADLTAKYPCLWRTWYDRLGYSPAKLTRTEHQTAHDVFEALKSSRQQARNLLGRSGRPLSNCFSLPNRRFSFLPVVPDDDNMEDEDLNFLDDPPPVSFDCDSFVLTGQGTEFVLLNPFTLTLSVYESILDHVIHSDEGMMEQAWKAASSKIVQHNQEDHMSDDEQENLLAADAIHETLLRNHYTQHSTYRVPPKQVLVGLADTLDVNLAEYFDAHGGANTRRRPPAPFADEDDEDLDEEFELSYHGIDAKPIWKDGALEGTMVAVARGVTRMGPNETEDDYCWEVLAWYKASQDDSYGNEKSCRFRGSFNALDVCPFRQCAYVNPGLQSNNEWGEDDNIFSMWSGDSIIRVIPLLDRKVPASQIQAIAQWKCRSPVTAMVVAPFSGDVVLVATNVRTLEIYQPTSTGAALQQEISIPDSIVGTLRKYGRPEDDIHSSPVTEFFVAKDVALDKAGFWTLQHSSRDGSTLILWREQVVDGKVTWSISTILKLPLSGQRTPKILYDGHRLLVYGQDHIGMILLVYQVRFSNEDHVSFRRVPIGQEACGGVFNVGDLSSARFANRVRHIALGGMENVFFEGLHMTANERFLVLNTKTGSLLSGSSTPFTEGLLVIDLQDEGGSAP